MVENPWAAARKASDYAAWCAGEGTGMWTRGDERIVQAGLLRDILGNPFRPATRNPAWLTWSGGAVVNLARATYEHRALPEGTLDPTRLAVLADALLDAGCGDAELLGHLRAPGPHVRGCHAVDALLGLS